MGGFWEPHTSSIDFCEENYRFTPYVAELLNSLSSLPIAWAGVQAWLLMPSRYRGLPRFRLCWLAFIAIGLGSALFHATLRRPAQALDEVPMVLANFVFVYCLARPQGWQASCLKCALVVAGLLLVVIYVVFEAYVVFFLSYGMVVVYLIAESARHVFFLPASCNGPLLRLLWQLALGLYGGGFGLWVTDNLLCSKLGVGHLHIVWHFLACGGTLVFVLLLVALTADRDGVNRIQLKWCGSPVAMMPFLALPEDLDSASGVRGKTD